MICSVNGLCWIPWLLIISLSEAHFPLRSVYISDPFLHPVFVTSIHFLLLLASSAAVPTGVDLPGERAGGGEATWATSGGDSAPLQLPCWLHPGGQKHQPLH